MKKFFIFLLTAINLFFMVGCSEDTFPENSANDNIGSPKDLFYSDILNAREFSFLRSGAPVIDTDGLIPTFEIISGRKEDGTLLDASYMDDVSIQNPVEVITNLEPENFYVLNGETITSVTTFDTRNSGIITIEDENKFDIGNYFFTIKVTTNTGERTLSSTFEDAFHINVGPELVSTLLYSPIAQNLVVGSGIGTTQPFLINGNPDVTFELNSDTDKLDINPETGIISLRPDYTTVVNDTIFPTVRVTSNISGEFTEFQGESFLLLVASTTPVVLPRQTNFFFYPTLEANNKIFGYSVDVIDAGLVLPENIWIQGAPSPLANQDMSLPVIDGKQALITNIVVGGQSEPHESDVIINSQDLSGFSLGFKVSAVFYTQNRFVEYLPDGSTPTDLEVYISTDYVGDNAAATWIQVNDQVSCQINDLMATPFIGTPYPGDQRGALDPDGRKDPSRNADGRWVRCELDLEPYKLETNFTLKFKVRSFFTGTLMGSANGRAGRYFISDVHFKATEQ
ncbi:hypothetical protein [Aquimarina algiphila]|uniref:hypothetical protein n=1 Tax=Aquimarina algiphila TaxID=2047982 RepID=UPI0024908C1C|nr:hypothetical protein [Aquimarina algiphila]